MRSLLRPIDYMESEKIDYNMIEPGIRSLVEQMNKIPFIETVSSCEGHMGDSIFEGFAPDPGFTFMNGGHIAFDIEAGHLESAGFAKEVSELTKRNGFSAFNDVEVGPEHVHMVSFNTSYMGGHISDLARHEKMEESDSVEIRLRKSCQVDTAAAEKRKLEYKKFWSELENIAKKYSK